MLSTALSTGLCAQATITGEIGGGVERVVFNGSAAPISDGWSVPDDPDDIVVAVREDGSFSATLPVSEAGFYRLAAGGRSADLFVSAGAASQVVVPAKAGAAISFDGDHAVENRYLFELSKRLAASEQMLNATYRTLYRLTPGGFTERIEAMEEPVRSAHATFVADHPNLPAAFVRRANGDIDSWFALTRVIYPSLHHQLTGALAAVPADYYATVAGKLLQRTDLLSSTRYVTLLDALVERLSAPGPLRFSDTNLPREKLESRYRAIRALEAPASVRDHLLEQMFELYEGNYGARDWGAVVELLEQDQPGHPLALRFRPVLDAAMAEREKADQIRVFKTVDGHALEAHVFVPETNAQGDRHSAYLFFHGGGWAIGAPEWGYANCERMAARGMVAISFEYRLADVHGSKMFAAIEDVQSAIAWARAHADELEIDTARIVAAGFSAGAHLAGAAAMLDAPEALGESARPNAIILQSSSYDLTKGPFFDTMTDGSSEAVSLQHQVGPDLVPALLLHSTGDHLAPIGEFTRFVERMKELDNDFEHHIFEHTGHFFRNPSSRARAIELTDAFLVRRGF